MSFKQLYYTSCQKGLRGSPGFQVNAATPDIDKGNIRQVERLGVYIPPIEAPSRPSPEELEAFPLSMTYQHLSDGTTVLAQAKYLGEDYSGRYGNYFTHSLLLEQRDEIGRMLPIDLWRSPEWITTESSTTELPTVDEPKRGTYINQEKIQKFLKENDRLDHVKRFVTAIQQSLDTRRKIIIIDDSDAVAMWIAAGTYALPRNLAMQLTFNTYVKNPYQTDVLVVGTTPDTDFGFAPHEIEHMVYLFDFKGDRFTTIAECSKFSRLVEEAYRKGQANNISKFSSFVSRVAPEMALEDLDVAFSCHSLANGFAVPDVDRVKAAGWIAQHVSQLTREQTEIMMGGLLTSKLPDEEVKACANLFNAVRDGEVNAEVRATVTTQVVEWLVSEVPSSAEPENFLEVVKGLQVSSGAQDAARPHRSAWLKELKKTRGHVRVGAILLLGEKLGYLDQASGMRRISEIVIGPAVTDRTVQQVLTDVASREACKDIHNGVGAYLCTKADDGGLFLEIASFLAEEDVQRLLESYAKEENAHLLLFRILGARSSRKKALRLDSFRRCHEEVKKTKGGVQWVDHAFEAIWYEKTPTVKEALTLLKELPNDVIVKTGIPGRLTGSLVAGVDLGKPGKERVALAKTLGGREIRGALRGRAAKIEVFEASVRLRNAGWQKELGPALKCTEKKHVSRELGMKLMHLAAYRVLGVESTHKQSELLMQALKITKLFSIAYVDEMKKWKSHQTTISPRDVATMMKIWSPLVSGGFSDTARALQQSVILDVIKKWGKRDLDEVDDALSDDKKARNQWRSVLDEMPRDGLFSKLTNWLGLSILAFVMIVAIGIFVTMPEQPQQPRRGTVGFRKMASSAKSVGPFRLG